MTETVNLDALFKVYRRLKSPFRVAKLFNLDVQTVWDLIEEHPERLTNTPLRHGGEGRPDIACYLVAKRRVADEGWDNDSPEIKQARADYEAGTHDMVTGRDGGWLLMYLIPRTKIKPRPHYFTPAVY